VVGETETVPDVPLAVKFVPVHDVALVELHVRVAELPDVIDVGEAESVAVGADTVPTVTVTVLVIDPPVPIHVAV